MSDARDRLFADPLGETAPFTFDRDVARVFPDMIRRSVPGYPTVVALSGLLAARFASAGSTLYDLGCSLGASTLAMRRHIEAEGCRIVAVDNSPAMLERCREVIEADGHPTPVELREGDIREVPIEDASMVVLNYTLQFIPLADREPLLARIATGLRPGGVLVLSEKVTLADPALEALNIDLHHQFKRANGYSALEVAQKRSALENVLLPETLDVHRARCHAAGFASCDVWFQCFNFASLVALKR
ncbi:carboxy-S-adenosyl-L-methionine synthase CmoA [Pseudohaliea rubra]|uniref:Carboxy-S-adenosyl-L-methionine synthase n=1 Tax=Pseudohaliea rubra DSM 19751 TaxID=1265313 RepID=A0A095VR40_9GAMM|nr:carboxy-S-adenosyl-L-methionine synthase CmoA [Pseudohaliea rubra]KGE03932.1 tRNA (uridine-5-oxyacetic acid methyl ester) 34 synthase [Pseudohaliea rubra DSM 19751]